MEILTSVRRLYISFKSLVNDIVYNFGRAALLLLVEVQNHTVPVRERSRIRVNSSVFCLSLFVKLSAVYCIDTCTLLKGRISDTISLHMLQEYAERLGRQRFYLDF